MGKRIKECDLLKKYAEGIRQELKRYNEVVENGTGERFFTDGQSIDIIVNHIIHYKKLIRELCEQLNVTFPEEFYLPTPPKQDRLFMAKKDQRFKDLNSEYNGRLTLRRIPYNDSQLSII